MKARAWFFRLAAIVGLCSGAAWFCREPIHRWQQRRLLAASQAFFRHGNLRSAYLSARQILQNDPRNATACALLAQIADAARSPEAVLWRQRLVEIEPGQSGALLDLAATAVRLGEPFVAEQALAQVGERDRDTVAFHQIAAACALAAKQPALADDHFQKALQLDPKNETLQLNLATLRVGAAKENTAAESRAVLDRLRKNPSLHQAATRALLASARKRKDDETAMQLAADLRQNAGATPEDRMLHLEELQGRHDPKFDAELKSLQAASKQNPGQLYALMTWMNAHGLAAQSVEWSATLPPGLRGQVPVPIAVAEAYTVLGEWTRLREVVAKAEWGELDFVRLAIHARALDEMSSHIRDPDFKLKWERAVIATHGEPHSLAMLARLVGGWGWKTETTQLWWRIASGSSGQRPALKELQRIYSADKNTVELYRVARRALQLEPANPAMKNNAAMLALLLGSDTAEAHRFAGENFRLAPDDPMIASTRAFSLHLQNRTREAVEIMAQLPEAVLRDPSVAACYGVLLAAAGDHEKAKPFLEAASQQRQQLLPEEIALVDAALKQP